MKIKAVGKIGNMTETVRYKDGKFECDDMDYLMNLLNDPKPIGGTYYPEVDDPLNVYFTLKDRYFDSEPEITVVGELPTIPCPEGEDAIY